MGRGFSSFAVVANRVYTLGNTNKTDTVFCFEAATGKVLWKHSYPCDPQPLSYEGGPSATPAVHGLCVYTFSKQGHLFCRLATDPPRELWRNKSLKTLINSSVLWQGLLFGFNDTDLSCISWDTGEVKWTSREVRKGSLILAGSKLLLLSETGKLVVAEPTDRSYEPLAQARILEGRCWTTPVLSGRRIFARTAEGDVVCLDASGRGLDQGP